MKPRVKRLQRKKPDLYIKREDSRSSKRGRCERFVYYYIDGKFGRLPFDSRNIATQKNLSKNAQLGSRKDLRSCLHFNITENDS